MLVPPQKPVIIDQQTGKRIVGDEVLGPFDQGQTISLECLVNGGKNNVMVTARTCLSQLEHWVLVGVLGLQNHVNTLKL